MSNFRQQHSENHKLKNKAGGALSISELSGSCPLVGLEIQAGGALSKSGSAAWPVSESKFQVTGPGVCLSQSCCPARQKQKAPPSPRGEAAVGQKCPFCFAWTCFFLECLAMSHTQSHVELKQGIRLPFHMPHFPVRRRWWPVCNFYQ